MGAEIAGYSSLAGAEFTDVETAHRSH